jgi:hypothetical protein
MARNVNNLYDLFRDIVRKERSVFVKISQFNSWMDSGQLDAIEEWFAPYGETQKLHDALRQIRVYYQFTSDSAGIVTFPSDYLHILGSPFTVTGSTVNEITFVQESELPFALKSQLRPVSNSYPIAVDTATGFSIYPQQAQAGYFNYLKRPAAITLAVTQVGRVVTYDPVNSIQPQFSDVYINNILAKALKYAGVYMNEEGVSSFANRFNQETK